MIPFLGQVDFFKKNDKFLSIRTFFGLFLLSQPWGTGGNFSFTDDIMDGYTIGFLITIAIGGFVIFKFLRLMKDSGAELRNTSMDERDVFDEMSYSPGYSNCPGNINCHDND